MGGCLGCDVAVGAIDSRDVPIGHVTKIIVGVLALAGRGADVLVEIGVGGCVHIGRGGHILIVIR